MDGRLLHTTTPKARKVYSCGLCGLRIEAAEKHVAQHIVDADGAYTFRMHTACHALTGDWDQDDWECNDPSEFRNHYLGMSHGMQPCSRGDTDE